MERGAPEARAVLPPLLLRADLPGARSSQEAGFLCSLGGRGGGGSVTTGMFWHVP